MEKFYSTFTEYYCQILVNSVLSEKQFKSLESYFQNLFKHKNLLVNLSCNFLDYSFLEYLKSSHLKRANLNIFHFVKFLVEAYIKFTAQMLPDKKLQSNSSHSKSSKKKNSIPNNQNRMELERNCLVNITLYDLLSNMKNSRLKFYDPKLDKQFFEESLKEIHSIYSQLAPLLEIDKPINVSIQEMFGFKGYSFLREDGTFSKANI